MTAFLSHNLWKILLGHFCRSVLDLTLALARFWMFDALLSMTHSIKSSIAGTMNNCCTAVINHKNLSRTSDENVFKTFCLDYRIGSFFVLAKSWKFTTSLWLDFRNKNFDGFVWVFVLCFAGEQKFWHLIRTTVNHKLKNHLFQSADGVVECRFSTHSTPIFRYDQLFHSFSIRSIFELTVFVVRTKGCAEAIPWLSENSNLNLTQTFFGYYPFIVVITCIVIVLLSA